MKILFANKYYHPSGGPETVMLQSKEKLESLGNEVVLFSMQHPRNLETKYSRYFVCNVDYNNHNGSPLKRLQSVLKIFYSLEAKKKMELLLDEEKPDLAHLHNIYHQISPSILPVLNKKNIPVVMTLHDFKLICPNYTFLRDDQTCEECEGKHFYKAVIHKCVKDSYWKSLVCSIEMYLHKILRIYDKVDRFIVLSLFTKQRFINYGLPEDKLVFLPNYINIPYPHDIKENDRYILFFGRLTDTNGIFTLIKAMKKLPEIELRVLGEGEQKDYLINYVRENKMENIKLLGFKQGDELKKLISESYFTVFPNHGYHVCPMSILESFAYNKPVIGSNRGSIPELINDEIDGLLFEPGNVEDLAEKIKYLYHHPLLALKMGISARKKVEEKYSEEGYYKKLLGIYDTLIKNGGKSYV